jgi:hypothetical protein
MGEELPSFPPHCAGPTLGAVNICTRGIEGGCPVSMQTPKCPSVLAEPEWTPLGNMQASHQNLCPYKEGLSLSGPLVPLCQSLCWISACPPSSTSHSSSSWSLLTPGSLCSLCSGSSEEGSDLQEITVHLKDRTGV